MVSCGPRIVGYYETRLHASGNSRWHLKKYTVRAEVQDRTKNNHDPCWREDGGSAKLKRYVEQLNQELHEMGWSMVDQKADQYGMPLNVEGKDNEHIVYFDVEFNKYYACKAEGCQNGEKQARFLARYGKCNMKMKRTTSGGCCDDPAATKIAWTPFGKSDYRCKNCGRDEYISGHSCNGLVLQYAPSKNNELLSEH